MLRYGEKREINMEVKEEIKEKQMRGCKNKL